jgi:DNA 3'-phosphatase
MMPKIFENCNILLVGLSAGQKKILSQNIIAEGGSIVATSAPIFGKAAFNASVTHILIESTSITYEALCKLSNCISVPTSIPVLHTSWVVECMKQKSLVSTDRYLIAVSTGMPDQTLDLSVHRTRSASSIPGSVELTEVYSEVSVAVSCEGDEWNERYKEKMPDNEYVPLIGDTIDFREYAFGKWYDRSDIVFSFVEPTMLYSKPVPDQTNHSLLPVIIFDMDHTIITTKSGNVYPRDNNDWKIWHENVISKLRSLPPCRFLGEELFTTHILFVSNQGGLYKKKEGVQGFCSKVDKIRQTLGVPISFICATATNSLFRKPLPGMWEFFKGFMQFHYPSFASSEIRSVGVSLLFSAEALLVVGDAAGRPAEGARKKDFSDSDLKFAMNIGSKVISSFL